MPGKDQVRIPTDGIQPFRCLDILPQIGPVAVSLQQSGMNGVASEQHPVGLVEQANATR